MRASNPRFTETDSRRPSDLLPWADPYIARLVSKLQAEVRNERTQSRIASRVAGTCLAEIEPPTPRTDGDWEWQDEPRRPHYDKP